MRALKRFAEADTILLKLGQNNNLSHSAYREEKEEEEEEPCKDIVYVYMYRWLV